MMNVIVNFSHHTQVLSRLKASISSIILGKDHIIDMLLTCLISEGHALIEDVPGVGKTSLASALAHSIEGSFQRIQFTSDLLPSDIIGVSVFHKSDQQFEFHPGPLFANIVVADEINRSTPKTQSALLEAMQEGQVSVDRQTYVLPAPFMVIATQNPIEHQGTYPLPESQLDRFFMKLSMGYPNGQEELQILTRHHQASTLRHLKPVCSAQDICDIQAATLQVRIDPILAEYLVSIVQATRSHPDIALGVSPRSSISLYRAAQSYALLSQRDYVIPDDIKKLAVPVLHHRMVPRKGPGYSAELIEAILNELKVPM